MFYWSWAGGQVLIVRTACCSRNMLCFTGLGPEDRCSSWGLFVVPETCYVLLVLGRRTGSHREDCLLFQKRVMFYWSWAGGQVLIVRTACCSRNVLCFTGLRPENWCSSWGLFVVQETCYVLLVLGRRTGAHREECLLFKKVLCFTGLVPEDRCSSWGLLIVPETCYVLLVLGRRTGAHREDCLLFQKRVMFYWSWARGPVLIVRTACYFRNVLCLTGLGPEDWCSSWGLLVVPEMCYVLLVLGRRTGAHREDCLLFQKRVMFYWSWAGGQVLIVRNACCSRNVLCFTGLGPEDRCSSWGLLVVPETCYVLLVLGRRTGAHREDCLLFHKRVMFYWSWTGGQVLIVRTACCSRNVLCFTGLGPEDWCSSWGLFVVPETCYVLLVLGRRTGAHREDCLLFQKRVMFYWSWAGGPVLIVRTVCCSRNVLCFTGLGPEDWCSSLGLLVVPETCYVLLVLGRRTGAHREDCLLFQKRFMFYWSWAEGQVLIVRTACCSRNVLCFNGLWPEDRCSSWGMLVVQETCYVLLVLCPRTGAHREDCLLFQKRAMFYWSWAGGPVLIVRTAYCSRNVLCFTGLGPEDWCSSWGLLVISETCYVLLVLGRRTGAHREDCLLFKKRVMFYWSWAGGQVLIVRNACCSSNVLCFTGLGPEDRCSSWGLLIVPETCYVLLVLGQRTGAHREDCLLFQKRVMFYWSWAGGLVLIVRSACCSRNVLCFTGFGPEDRCSSWGLFVFSRNVLCFTGLGPEDRCSSWGLLVVP